MVIGNRKEYAPLYSSFFRKSPAPSKNRLAAILIRKKPSKSVPGIEPGLLGQNATALLLAPPPRPWVPIVTPQNFPISYNSQHFKN